MRPSKSELESRVEQKSAELIPCFKSILEKGNWVRQSGGYIEQKHSVIIIHCGLKRWKTSDFVERISYKSKEVMDQLAQEKYRWLEKIIALKEIEALLEEFKNNPNP